MPGFGALGAIKEKASHALGGGWNVRYEEFDISKPAPGDEPADDASSQGSLPEPERPPLRHIDKYIRPECPCLSKRVTVALLTCMGFIVMFGMRCNMGMAKLKLENEALKMRWSLGTISAVDSAIFWGYLLTQVPGGFLAAKYPANRLFGAAIGISSFLNLLVPGAYELSPATIIIVRVTQGLVEGVTYPACHGIWRYWAPPLERSRLATLAFCGCYAGVMFALPLSGELIKRIGWQAPFYFYGCMGLTWYLSWLWLVFEKPCYHPTIEAKELLYIENSLEDSNKDHTIPTIKNTPWKAFFTSMPVYAIFVANFCRSWNFYLLVLFQASYINDVFKMDIEENAIAGALPHLLMTIIVPSGGILADFLRKRGILTTTQVRKLFNCGGFGMEATFFLVVAFAKTATQAIVALTFGVAFSGFAISGFNVNHLDIAPKYASILMGMSNGIGTIAGCICPLAVHAITDEHHSADNWKTVFIMAATVHFIGVIFYGIFASGELQPWADSKVEEEKQWNQLDETVPMKTGQSNGLLQRQLSGKMNYGSVETENLGAPSPNIPVVPAINPFMTSTNPFRQEPVQPQPQDSYMHGPPPSTLPSQINTIKTTLQEKCSNPSSLKRKCKYQDKMTGFKRQRKVPHLDFGTPLPLMITPRRTCTKRKGN